MKILRQIWANKTLWAVGLILLVLAVISDRIAHPPEPKVTREISSVAAGVQALWVREGLSTTQTTDWDANRLYFNQPGGNEKLVALDTLTGKSIWGVSVEGDSWRQAWNQWGVIQILETPPWLFTVTATNANGYNDATGQWLWSDNLGDGHVRIYAQREDSLLRVYYGDNIFELSQETGEIVNEQRKNDIVWIQDNVEIRCPLPTPRPGVAPECGAGLSGKDRAAGTSLWVDGRARFYAPYGPGAANDVLVADVPGSGSCVLDAATGAYSWCLPERPLSNTAIDGPGRAGYFLSADFTLKKINLSTGVVSQLAQFAPETLPAEMQRNPYGYTVGVTKDAVIVGFGDSGQTFGLSIAP